MRHSPSHLPRGIRRLFRLPSTEARMLREADDEVREHVERWAEEYRAGGMSDADARAAAWQRFGDPHEYREHVAHRARRMLRWQRAAGWLAEWGQDVRFAMRHFRKAPGFAAVAIMTLALGIGANTAIFSVVHHLLVAPLPYPNGNRIVAVKTVGRFGFIAALASMGPGDLTDPPPALAKELVSRSRSFEQIGGIQPVYLTLRPDDRQDTVSYAFITANFLDVLGARPALGRMFHLDEEPAGTAHRVATISHRWWLAAYGGRHDAVGNVVEYEGNKYTIIGVLPPGFGIPMSSRGLDELWNPSPDVWLPAPIQQTTTLIGLLRRGISAADASRELTAITRTLDRPAPAFLGQALPDSIRVRAMRAEDFVGQNDRQTIEILFAAVSALLLIACANVANLLLLRAWMRRREFAVRMGLGAGRGRLLRLALTESVLLTIVAGVVGILIAQQGLHVISALRPRSLDALGTLRLEPAVLLWTVGVSVLIGLLLGASAAFFVSTQHVGDFLRGEARTSSGLASQRVRSSLVVAEIALSFAMLVSAGLLTRSFVSLSTTRLGFDPQHLVSIDVLMPGSINGSGRGPAVRGAIVQRLREIPGVTSAAEGLLPTAGYRFMMDLVVNTPTGPRSAGVAQPMYTTIDTNYFRTSSIALLEGREPITSPADAPPPRPNSKSPSGSPPQRQPIRILSTEIVVNRALARRIAPDGHAIGQSVRMDGGSGAPWSDDWSTITGIVDDVRLPGHQDPVQRYQIYTLPGRISPSYIVRFASVPPNVESVLRSAIQSVDPLLVARRTRIADDYLREALAPTQFMLSLLGAFAIVAIVLAAVGLYGSIAFGVTQRTREIGVRVAMGSTPHGIVALVLRDGISRRAARIDPVDALRAD